MTQAEFAGRTMAVHGTQRYPDVYNTPERLLWEDEIRNLFENGNDRRSADHFYAPTYVKAT